METKQPTMIGVDVSKDTLDTALLFDDDNYTSQCFSNDDEGIKHLLSWVAEQGAKHCPLCVEASGGFELTLCSSAYKAGHSVRRVTPPQIANYRKSITLRNKTDCDDARLIAKFAATVSTTEWHPISSNIQRLRDLLKRRRMLKQVYTAMRNSADTLQDPTQCRSAQSDLKHIQRRIKQIDACIAKVISSDKQLAKRCKLLCSIPSIGELTAAIIIAGINVDDFQNARQFCAFMGITPMRRQSGRCESKSRISKIGNVHLRSALFMCALSARAYSPLICNSADKLQSRRTDLTKKQVILACVHKLGRIIFGVLKHQHPFDPNHYTQLNHEETI